VQVEMRFEVVLFGLARELGQLGETLVDHDQWARLDLLRVGDEDSALVLICVVVLVIEPHAGLLTLAHFFVLVEQVEHVSRDRRPMHETD